MVSVSFSKVPITKVCVFPPSGLSFCEILLRLVRRKSPFRHRLHSAAGPQAPAELTVAIATTTDNYPAKDRYSRQSEKHLVFMLKTCRTFIVEWPSSFLGFFFAIWGEFQKEDVYRVRAVSHHDDSQRWIINITCVAVRTCSKVWQLCSETCESPRWRDLLQALICQQTFTSRVAACKYGLLIVKCTFTVHLFFHL